MKEKMSAHFQNRVRFEQFVFDDINRLEMIVGGGNELDYVLA